MNTIDDVTINTTVEQWQEMMDYMNLHPSNWCDHTDLLYEDEYPFNPFLCLWKCGRVIDQIEFFEMGNLNDQSFKLTGKHIIEAIALNLIQEEVLRNG